MREYGDNANLAKARGLSLQGGAFSLTLAFLSSLSIRLGPIEAGLTFVPMIAIFLWPRGSSSGLSCIFIFLTGMIVDIVSAGPLGLSAIIYLALYGLLQPDQRSGQSQLKHLWPQFLVWVVAAFCAVLVAGQLFISGRTAWWPLFMQSLFAVLAFPMIFSIRQGLRQLISDSSDSGFAR